MPRKRQTFKQKMSKKWRRKVSQFPKFVLKILLIIVIIIVLASVLQNLAHK